MNSFLKIADQDVHKVVQASSFIILDILTSVLDPGLSIVLSQDLKLIIEQYFTSTKTCSIK